MQVHHPGRVEVIRHLLVMPIVPDGVRVCLIALGMRVQFKLRPGHAHQCQHQHERQPTEARLAADGIANASDSG